MSNRAQYSRWDGTQVGFDLDADALLEEMTDDLLYHGDLNAALRRMMQQGFQDRQGRDVQGMREMLEKLREQRREQLDRYDLGGVYEDIANRLDEIVDEERAGIDRRVDEAQQSGDKRREELLDELAQQRREQLEQLPPDLAGRVSDLQQYDWMDDAARQHFEELMEELKKQLLDSMFNQLNEGMSQMSPEQLARMKDMIAELNHMLEQREARRGARLRRLHGALRRLLPRQPADARRAARADGASDGADAAAAQLDDARAARAAAGDGERAARRHGPALAGGPARPEPAQRVPADGLGPGHAASAATSRCRSTG